MSFQRIESPSPKLYQVKVKTPDLFRPAAIDDDPFLAYKKAEMEQYESILSFNRQIVATAAHKDKEVAINNAQEEAVERMSLSAWWACERPVLARLDDALVKNLHDYYFPGDSNFDVSIGFIRPACDSGYVAVSILENRSDYPHIVLGGSFGENPKEASYKAFLESIQSWTGTRWLGQNNPNDMPYWDTPELAKRITDIKKAKELGLFTSSQKPFGRQALLGCLENSELFLTKKDGLYVAGIGFNVETSGLSHKIAELGKRSSEEVTVFTQYNH